MNEATAAEIKALRERAKWFRDQASSTRMKADRQDGLGAQRAGYAEAANYSAEAIKLENMANDMEAMACN